MKLMRIGARGAERPAVLHLDGTIRDLSGIVDDIAGSVLKPEGLKELSGADLSGLPELDKNERIGPCVGRVGKFICVGLNYADHAAESGLDVPKEPVLFMKRDLRSQ